MAPDVAAPEREESFSCLYRHGLKEDEMIRAILLGAALCFAVAITPSGYSHPSEVAGGADDCTGKSGTARCNKKSGGESNCGASVSVYKSTTAEETKSATAGISQTYCENSSACAATTLTPSKGGCQGG